MKLPKLPIHLMSAACVALILASCGGGSNMDATSSPAPAPVVLGQSTVSGTITGFGSVIVDGVRIDNSAVAAGKELDDGSTEAVELKLGQHVDVDHDGALVATKVRVSAQVEGAVSAVNPVAGNITVLNQLITVNADPTLGPVTVLDGYSALTMIQVNDEVEVHALIKTDAVGNVTLQATRIEKRTVIDAADHVNGYVTGLSAANHTFKLGALLIDYTNAKLLPADGVLSNGTEVHVAVPLGTIATGAAVKATVVRIRDHKAEVGAKDTELGGAISSLDASTKMLTVNGVKVDASAATFDQPGKTFTDLKINDYIVVKGSYSSDGVMKAAKIVLRGMEHDQSGAIELHGSVLDFVSVSSFKVRGIQVDATGVVLDASSCGTATLADGLQVEVTGNLTQIGQVKATAISCEKPDDAHAVLSRLGMVSNVDSVAKSFSLVTSKETLMVKWTSDTFFRNVSAGSLGGKRVEVEGTMANGVLQATKIVLAQD